MIVAGVFTQYFLMSPLGIHLHPISRRHDSPRIFSYLHAISSSARRICCAHPCRNVSNRGVRRGGIALHPTRRGDSLFINQCEYPAIPNLKLSREQRSQILNAKTQRRKAFWACCCASWQSCRFYPGNGKNLATWH